MSAHVQNTDQLRRENAELRALLEEADDTLRAIRAADVDALVVGNDIYTLDSANAATNRLRKDVLAQMEEAVIAFDNDDHAIYLNQAAERQYGVDASYVLGRAKAQVFREVWPNTRALAECLHALETVGVYQARSVHARLDGTSIHVESTVSRMRDASGVALGYLAVIRNITERVRYEETLHSSAVALAQRERQFATLVENSPDIFIRTDRGLRFLYASPISERYTGIPSNDYLGKTAQEIGLPDEFCQAHDAALAKVIQTSTIERIRFKLNSQSQGMRTFAARLVPEFSEDGTVESVLTIAADITDQETIDAALRDSRARLQFTFESAKIGEWELDIATGEIQHSLRHDRCFGYREPVNPWIVARFLEHVHPDDRARVAQIFEQCKHTGEPMHYECRVVWPDRSVHWIEKHGSLYGEPGGKRRMAGIVADTTARKLAEEALRDADRRKDEFLATLAHELRNPLAPIRNALQIMRLTSEPAVQEEARSTIERQLRQMVHLVDDLLDVSRISRGKIELRRERADVATLITTAIETSRPLIDSGKHQLTVRLPAPQSLVVNGDVTRLCQIISNLLNNAAKYTPPGGRIEVSAHREHHQAVVTVIDSGMGIPAEILPRIFDMFAQVDRTLERSQGGLGIGLALVRRLVELHGGSVEAHSEGQDRGSQFTVRVPLANAGEVAPAAFKPHDLQVDTSTDCRVLVVDDNLDSAESLSQVLRILGYQTHTVHDGVEAVRAAETRWAHVALLDIGLPKINGHDVARKIREYPWGKDMLLIALSGWSQEEDRRKSKAAGFDHHFVKPVDLEALTALLARKRVARQV